MGVYRTNRREFLLQFVGRHYSEDGARDRVPVNFVAQGVGIYERLLMARLPRPLITTKFTQLKATAKLLELATVQAAQQIELESTFRAVIRDALFGPATVKVALSRSGTVEIEGGRYDVGQPFVERVSPDDLLIDLTARNAQLRNVQFIGNRYRVPFEWALDSGLYDADALRRLAPSEKQTIDEMGEERAEAVGYGEAPAPTEFIEHIALIDLYLPHYGLMITVPDLNRVWRPVREAEWDGPATGPYRMLGFDDVPDALLPLPPVALWMDMHEAANTLINKLVRQAKRQKFNPAFRGGDEEDAAALNGAPDGNWVRIEGELMKEIRSGGIDPNTLAFALQLKDLLNYFGGNLEILGGLSAGSETLGQDQLLSSMANRRVQAMQGRATDFMRDVMRDLAWYLFYDPLIEMPLTYRVPGTNLDIPVALTPEAKRGDFLDYNFQIDPYSAQDQPPGQRLQTLMQLLQTVVLPAMPVLAQQGMVPDFQQILRLIARYTNMAELDEIIAFVGPAATAAQQAQGEPVGQPPTKSPVTHRTVTRVNRPGRTEQGADFAKIQTLLGAGVQNSEARAAWGGTG